MDLKSSRNIEDFITKIELSINSVTGIDIRKDSLLNSDEFLVCVKQIKQKIKDIRNLQENRNQLSIKQNLIQNNSTNSDIIMKTENIKREIKAVSEELKKIDEIIAR